MKLTRATDYALFLVAHLGGLEAGTITSIGAVASEYNIPERFLANIVNKLANGGIIASFKGVNGGIRLARDASLITVLEVVETMEESLALVKCQSSDPSCPLMENCTVRGFMDQTHRELMETFGRTTIESLKTHAHEEKATVN